MRDHVVIQLIRLSHVVVGMVGLVLFWVPVIATKGGRLHIRSGRLFTYCAYYGGSTGLIFSVWAIVDAPSFFGDSRLVPLGPVELAVAIENARFLYSITGFLAIAVLAGTYFGVCVVRTRNDHGRLRSPLLLAALTAYGLWSLALLAYGAWSLVSCYAGMHLLPRSNAGRYWINVVLGMIGACGVIRDFGYVRRAPMTPWAWRYQHMECMLGAGIGFYAAGFFFITKELLDFQLRGAGQLAPMLLPVAVGTVAMWVWIAREERRLEGSGTHNEAGDAS